MRNYSGALKELDSTPITTCAGGAPQRGTRRESAPLLCPCCGGGCSRLGRLSRRRLEVEDGSDDERLLARAVVLFNRGSSLHRQGRHRAAVDDLNEAVQLAPLRADFYDNRALARRKLNDFGRAVDDYRIAAAIRSG